MHINHSRVIAFTSFYCLLFYLSLIAFHLAFVFWFLFPFFIFFGFCITLWYGAIVSPAKVSLFFPSANCSDDFLLCSGLIMLLSLLKSSSSVTLLSESFLKFCHFKGHSVFCLSLSNDFLLVAIPVLLLSAFYRALFCFNFRPDCCFCCLFWAY